MEDRPVHPRTRHRLTVASLVDTLGPEALELVDADAGAQRQVTRPVFLDDLAEPGEGLVVLAGGVLADSARLSAVLGSGCAAVVVQRHTVEAGGALVAEARAAGVAVLTTPEEMSWHHLRDLIEAAVAAGRISVAKDPGEDLFTLANELAYRLSGAVTIEDEQHRLLAYSNLPHQPIDASRRETILGRRVPEDVRELNEVPRGAAGPVLVPPAVPGDLGRVAVGIRAGAQMLGSIWAMAGPELADDWSEALSRGAEQVAVVMLRRRSRPGQQPAGRLDALLAVLSGEEVSHPYRMLGLEPTTRVAVLALAVQAGERREDDLEQDVATAMLLEITSMYARAWNPKSLTVVWGNTVYAVIPLRARGKAEEHLVAIGRDVVRVAERTAALDVRCAVGPVVSDLAQLPSSRRLARTILQSLRHDSALPAVAAASDMRAALLLEQVRPALEAAVEAGSSVVGGLLEHDQRHGSEYAQSVLAWLEHGGDVVAAAAQLTVHENTLRYRLRRVREAFGVDLDDPRARLAAWLELKLRVG